MKNKKFSLLTIFPIILVIALSIGIVANLFDSANPNSISIVLFISLIMLLTWFFTKDKSFLTENSIRIITYSTILLILLIQIIVIAYFKASVYHDPFRVLSQAELLSRNSFDWSRFTYFYRYPNNVSLAFLMSLWLRVSNIFSISTNISLNILSIILIDSFILMMLKTVRKKSKNDALFIFLTLFFLIGPFSYSYYLQVFYSDLPSMYILLLTFIVLDKWNTLNKIRRYLYGILLFFAILIGQLIKPNLVVFVVAIAIVLLFEFKNNKTLTRQIMIPLSIICIGIFAAFPVGSEIKTITHFSNNARYEMPSSNWIWMSYKPTGHGTYNGADIKKMNSLPDEKARQKYFAPHLIERIKKLGFSGVIKLWVVKAGILLDTRTIPKSYTGGFIEVPHIYAKFQDFVSILESMFYRASFVFIYMISIMTLLPSLKTKEYLNSPINILAIVLAVGYIAFHTLVWETESRYGQVLFPILIFMDTHLSLSQTIKIMNKNVIVMWSTCGLIIVSLFSFFSTPGRKHLSVFSKTSTVVATQSSELSTQYKPKLNKLSKGSVASQKVKLNQRTNSFSLFMPHKNNINAYLLDTKSSKTYKFKYSDHRLRVKEDLRAGIYKVVVTSPVKTNNKFEITTTKKYKLANYPLSINGKSNPYQSFIYVASYNK